MREFGKLSSNLIRFYVHYVKIFLGKFNIKVNVTNFRVTITEIHKKHIL